MMAGLLSLFLILVSFPLIGNGTAVILLAVAQLCLLVSMIQERRLTGAGAFIFMNCLFFAIRPIHLLMEGDRDLFSFPFFITVDQKDLDWAMWYAAFGLLLFYAGCHLGRRQYAAWWQRRVASFKHVARRPIVTTNVLSGLLLIQVGTLLIMWRLGASGKGLYGSDAGAYIYELPIPLQAVQIFTLVVCLERFLAVRTFNRMMLLGFSGLLFLLFTYKMRDVSNFRGFYMTGLMVGGIACLARIKKKVSYVWLIFPILVALPLFRTLGENRYQKNSIISQMLQTSDQEQAKSARHLGPLTPYWNFFDARGDMNIFDTFTAATKSEPRFHPYILSWLYVPVHLVPRVLWKSKPAKGILIDVKFMHGAPYAPGIIGFFLLDGGLLWMLLCMAVLGYLISLLDFYVLTMPDGYLKCCLYGIVVINAMFLTRFYLWQYFYQVLYGFVPCIILARWVSRHSLKQKGKASGVVRHAAALSPGSIHA